uniref:Uncharacterized protein n=1 Tax=Meloidogyne javanica TaxID=6303 RepID=A0A915LTE6_MELJA
MKLTNFVICFLIVLNIAVLLVIGSERNIPLNGNDKAGYTVTFNEQPEPHEIQTYHIMGTDELENSMNTGKKGKRGSIFNIMYDLRKVWRNKEGEECFRTNNCRLVGDKTIVPKFLIN